MTKKKKKNLPSPLNKQPQPQKTAKEARLIEAHYEYSGPLPSPTLLRQFDDIVPGAAERILSMAEKQSEHRQDLEKTAIHGDSRRATQGLFLGAFIAVSVLLAAGILIYNGHDWAGGTIAAIDIVSLTSVFVYGTKSRKQERTQKYQTMEKVKRN